MKRIGKLVMLFSFLVFILFAESQAQRGMGRRGSGGWGPGSQYSRLYNPKTVETDSGEVVSVDTIAPMKGMSFGVHLKLKTDKETISVHLGPQWYLENQDMVIAVKDKITITGSRITLDGQPVIIAAQVIKGEETLQLRDENGFPRWSGWRRR
jgi:hypothetical protein